MHVQYILRGARIVFGDSKLWHYIWGPMAFSVAVFIGIIVSGWFLVVPRIAEVVEQRLGLDSTLGRLVASVGYGLIWWVLAGIIFTSIAGVFSSFLWEKLSLKVETKAYGTGPEARVPVGVVVFDSLLRMMFSTFICCFSVLCGWFLPFGILLAAWLSLYDYTASAFLRRKILFPEQSTKAFRCKSWVTFALTCGVIAIFPFVNVFLLPVFVAGGTLMVADSGSEG